MNKTANYQLNQWVKSDRVLMDDFNADNAKIDAALRANANAISAETSARISAVQSEANTRASAVQAARDACPLVTLRTATLSSAVSRYDLPLTGFDWDLYGEVIIYALLKCQSSLGTVNVLLNDNSGNSYYYRMNIGNTEYLHDIRINSTGTTAHCKIFRSPKGFYCQWRDNTLWHEPASVHSRQEANLRSYFQTMNFIGNLAAGTKFTILGVRG